MSTTVARQDGQWTVQRVEAEILPTIQVEKILPRGMNADRFRLMALDLVRRKPEMLATIRQDNGLSFMNAVSSCAELGLSLNDQLGEAALIIEEGMIKLRPMYRGLRKLALGSPGVKDIWADVIYQGEKYSVQRGSDPKLEHEPNYDPQIQKPENLIMAYAVALFADGHTHFECMGKWDVEQCREASKSWKKTGGGPWKFRPAEMWKKTALRRLTKGMNLENERLARAETLDNDDYEDMAQDPPMAPGVKQSRPLLKKAAPATAEEAKARVVEIPAEAPASAPEPAPEKTMEELSRGVDAEEEKRKQIAAMVFFRGFGLSDERIFAKLGIGGIEDLDEPRRDVLKLIAKEAAKLTKEKADWRGYLNQEFPEPAF